MLERIYINIIRGLMSNFPTFQATFTSNTCAFIALVCQIDFQPAFHVWDVVGSHTVGYGIGGVLHLRHSAAGHFKPNKLIDMRRLAVQILSAAYSVSFTVSYSLYQCFVSSRGLIRYAPQLVQHFQAVMPTILVPVWQWAQTNHPAYKCQGATLGQRAKYPHH